MHPAFARFVPQSASDTMSSFANNLASLAWTKLRSTQASGSRDNLSLHRWVLLKNSITVQHSGDSHAQDRTPCSDDICEYQDGGVSVQVHAVEPDSETEFEEEEVELDSIIDEDMFAFLFPDPGDAVAATDETSSSEEQWLDSLLETLGDEDEDELDLSLAAHGLGLSSPPSPLLELDDSAASLPPISVPCPVPYPVCRPPFVRPFDLECRDFCFASHLVRPYASPYDDIDDDPEPAVPDAIEDTSDDETDSASLSTPFSRSRSSLSLVDPALVPLPHDGRQEPHIFSSSFDNAFHAFESDQLPYHDYNSDSTPVYSPYHQTC